MTASEFLSTYCWRCQLRPVQLYHDPLLPDGDTIGVCHSCVIVRTEIAKERIK